MPAINIKIFIIFDDYKEEEESYRPSLSGSLVEVAKHIVSYNEPFSKIYFNDLGAIYYTYNANAMVKISVQK